MKPFLNNLYNNYNKQNFKIMITQKAKESFKKVTSQMAYKRGYEVEELKLYLLKETWLKGLEGEALAAFKKGVLDAK